MTRFQDQRNGEDVNSRHRAPRQYEDVFEYVNSFGRNQKALFFLLNFLRWPIIGQMCSVIFVTGTPSFHCVTANVTCPKDHCCHGCTSYGFESPFTTVITEWKLICDRAYLGAIMNSCLFAGALVGSLLSGMLSDAWGRKPCLFLCNTILIIGGIGSVFAKSVWLFTFLRFVTGFGMIGSLICIYVYSMELVSTNHRTAVGNLSSLCMNILHMSMAPLSYFISSWRLLSICITVPTVIPFLFWKWIPESPRWLVVQGKIDEAVRALKVYGSKDQSAINEETLRDLLEEVKVEQMRTLQRKSFTSLDLMRTPKIRKWTLIIGYQWFTVSFVSFGIMLFFAQLTGDIYINMLVLTGCIILRIPLSWVVLLKFGRRVPHALFIILGGVCLLIVLSVEKDNEIVTVLIITGYVLVDCVWTSTNLMNAELFPTCLRNTAQGLGSTCARMAGIIAPYMTMLGSLPGLSITFPISIFGCTAVLAGILMYWMPETLHSPMYQTVQQAEQAEEDFNSPCCGKRQYNEEETSESQCLIVKA